MKRIATLLVSILIAPILNAQSIEDISPELESRVYSNVAAELAVCSAFFQIISECLENTQIGAGTKYKNLSDRTLENAAVILMMSNTLTLELGKKEYDKNELWVKTQKSAFYNYEREYKTMLSEIMTCQNTNLISTKHLESCVAYYENPDALVEKWAQKLSIGK